MVNNCLKSNQNYSFKFECRKCLFSDLYGRNHLHLSSSQRKRWHPRSKCQHHKYCLCEHFTEGNAEISWNQLKPVALKQERGQTVTVLFHQQPFFYLLDLCKIRIYFSTYRCTMQFSQSVMGIKQMLQEANHYQET